MLQLKRYVIITNVSGQQMHNTFDLATSSPCKSLGHALSLR